MATIQDGVEAIRSLKTAVEANRAAQNTYFEKVLAAFNRLEAKILAGSDVQPIINEVTPIRDIINSSNSDLEVKSAEADVTGI